MSRLIDADALVQMSWVLPNRMTRETALECFRNIVNDAPTIDAETVRHGRWEDGKCTECGEDAPYTEIEEAVYDYDWEENLRFSHTETHREYNETPYCPNCGTKMDGGAEE